MYSRKIVLKKTFDVNSIFLAEVSVELSTIGSGSGDSGDLVIVSIKPESMGVDVLLRGHDDQRELYQTPKEISLVFSGEFEAALVPRILKRVAGIIEEEMPKLQKEADFYKE